MKKGRKESTGRGLLMLLDRTHPTVEDAETLRGIAGMILQKRRADAAKAAEPAEE